MRFQLIRKITGSILSSNLACSLALITAGLAWSAPTASAGEAELSGTAVKARMEAARDEIANVRSNIFLTLVDLDQVRGEREAQGPKFHAFTNQLAVMEDLCKNFAKHAEAMKQKGDAYFADWEAKNGAGQGPDAEKRFTERKRSYDSITRSMQDARQNFLSFFEDVSSIKTLLSGQRDQKSIARAKDLFMHANWRCIDTQRALMTMEEEFDRLAESFAKEPTH
jgi:hypothetical protein